MFRFDPCSGHEAGEIKINLGFSYFLFVPALDQQVYQPDSFVLDGLGLNFQFAEGIDHLIGIARVAVESVPFGE